MKNQTISVYYTWTAKPGKLAELKEIYSHVCRGMEENEPGALKMNFWINESDNTIMVEDLFQDANALGFHLNETAAAHFPSLLEIAVPGKFVFCGDVPEALQNATAQMGLETQFLTPVAGFNREAVSA